MSTTWEATEQVTNAVTGVVTPMPHRYVEVASGLNYLDPTTGQYQESQDLIELTADGGAAAIHGPAKLAVKANLNSAGAITIVAASNRVFKTQPLGIFMYNAASGQAQLVAPLQDCVGELVPPNQVVWKSAFGPLADLRLTYTKSGIESDLVLLQQPRLPDGWDPRTTRLELWHDWTGSPAPGLTPRVLYRETNAVVRSQMLEPDLTDQILDFGDLWFPTGAAYATDVSSVEATNTAREVRVPNLGRDPALVPVAKTWLRTPNVQVLIEGVRWPDVQPKLSSLPPASPTESASAPRDRLSCLGELPSPTTDLLSGPPIQLAPVGYSPSGLVLDYITVVGNGDYTFYSGTTYRVSSSAWFGGTLILQPGCFIKYDPGTFLMTYGSIVCNGTASSPSILTSKRDHVLGENFDPVGFPSCDANEAIWAYYTPSAPSFSGLRIRWPKVGVFNESYLASAFVSDCQFEFCQYGVYSEPAPTMTYLSGTYCEVINPWWTRYGNVTGGLTDMCNQPIRQQIKAGMASKMGSLIPTNAANCPDNYVMGMYLDDHVYNSNCWLGNVAGRTAFASFHDLPSGGGGVDRWRSGPTLITRRHAVTAWHAITTMGEFAKRINGNPGTKITWVGTDGFSYTNECVDYAQVLTAQGWDTDIAVILLDADVAVAVESLKLLPSSITTKLPMFPNTSGDRSCFYGQLPVIACNQHKHAFAIDMSYLTSGVVKLGFAPSWSFPSWSLTVVACCGYGSCFAFFPADGGDSGSPLFLLLNNELVLLTTWWGQEVGTFYGQYADRINGVISAIDSANNVSGNYEVTLFDLSGY